MSLGKKCIAAGVIVVAFAGAAQAEQTADRAESSAKRAVQAPAGQPSETVAVSVLDGRGIVWSGTLRIGGNYGSASFSQSKSEAADPCPGDARPESSSRSSSENMNFSISRYNWQQEPDRFNISLNWGVPVAACEGEGNDSFGFNRVVTLPPGQTVTVAGSGTMQVKLTRRQ
jgi:hypothetical protein